jgi:hypothetical protein
VPAFNSVVLQTDIAHHWRGKALQRHPIAQLASGRQTGRYPETAFEEMNTHGTFGEISLPTCGLQARDKFRISRCPLEVANHKTNSQNLLDGNAVSLRSGLCSRRGI